MNRCGALGVTLSVVGFACAPDPIVGEDVMPLDGAMHLDAMGHAGAYGHGDGATSPSKAANARRHADDRVAALDAALHARWVHRAVHESQGIDIDAVLRMLQVELASAQGRRERRDAVRRATCRLGDGNLRLVEADDAFVDAGIRVRAEGLSFLVEAVDERYDGVVAAGDVITGVDGVEVPRWREGTCVGPGSTDAHRHAVLARSFELSAADRDGKSRRPKTLTLRRATSGKARDVRLQWISEENAACVSGTALTGQVGVVTVHRLDCAPEAFVDQVQAAGAEAGSDHVLLDLRRVHGDDTSNAQALARSFAPAATVWASKRSGTRGAFEQDTLPETGASLNASNRWMLIGPRCERNCELAAAAIASDPAVVTVGRATAGSVADAETVSLGKGLSVLVPTVQYALPGTDTLLEARGVTPDIVVTATIDVLRRGHDPEVVAVARRIAGRE